MSVNRQSSIHQSINRQSVNRKSQIVNLLALFVIGFGFRLVGGLLFRQPGYTDAFYYSNVAQSLLDGRGFREDYTWLYFTPPPASIVNQPSSTYWMPLTSVIIWLGYSAFGWTGQLFLAGQLPIMLISAGLAPLGYLVGRDFGGPRWGWLVGLLMIFCGFYAPYFSLPDNFAPYALFSLLFLLCCYRALSQPKQGYRLMAWAGLWAGLAYLTRVDGVILLAVPFVCLVVMRLLKQPTGLTWLATSLMLLTFAATISPWLLRNVLDTGQLFPGGGTKTIFMRSYDDDFFSATKPLDLAYYLNQTQPDPTWGIGPLIGTKLGALLENWLIIGRGAMLIFTPLFVIGLFVRPAAPANPEQKSVRLWRRPEFLPFLVYAVLLYLAMSLIFTLPGTRGSLYHSSGGLLPFIYVAILAGLDFIVKKLGRRDSTRYALIILAVAVLFSVSFTLSRSQNWDADYNRVQSVASWLKANAAPSDIVMTPDTPSFNYVTHRPAIGTANEPIEYNLALMKRYGAKYLILAPPFTPFLFSDLYYYKNVPNSPLNLPYYPELQLAAEFDSVQIWQVVQK